jgi:class 3 adenylate cyclase/tetratricopeptide (TPR) repeat protein
MKCPKCGRENPADARFCEQCAAPVGQACANCGTGVSCDAKFCPQCGHPLKPVADDPRFASPRHYTPPHLADKILTSRLALEGGRKQVTVLFADIKGSMELLADLDPEDAQKLLEPVIERMIEAVHRYEGTVNKVLGDGIMALFGAPIAHEDHAVRACYAALRMQETVARYADDVQRSHGMPVTIRVGLNSGDIVVRTIGNDLQMDYTVIGQTVHLASRMEQMAKPGSVLMTANTLQLAEGYVSIRSLGPVPVKGLADLLHIHEVTGVGAARTRLQAALGRGLTRFIGRDVELHELHRAQQLARGGHGQVVAIVGEAGVGKSRLMHEFVHSPYAADWLVLEASSISYGQATPYLPFIELLRQYFKIHTHDSTRSIYEKVAGKILTLDASLLDAIPPVLDLLEALEDEHPFRLLDPPRHQQLTYQAVTRLLLSESRVRPVIVILEDLHWYDSLSLGLLNALIVGAPDARVLLMLSYRPDYRFEWKDRPNYHPLRLEPLVGGDLTELLQVLLGSDPNLTTLRSFVMERASGNPFFAEEIVRALAGTGVLVGARGNYRLASSLSSVKVPPTVQAVLAARIDALPAPEKRLLQEAAVIGHDVPSALLRAISRLTEDDLGGLLGNLQDAEFLYAAQLFPDLQYRFKHAFTHDVAYSGVLRDNRRDIHARVVDAVEKLYGDRLGEQVERLAHHAVRGELKEKAVHYLRQAGGKAAARSALSDARTWFEQALDILKSLPESRAAMEQAFEIRLELRSVLRKLGEGRLMLQHLQEAERLAELMKDDHRLGRVCAFMTTVLSTLDEMDEALRTGTRAVEIARRLGDLRLQILATTLLEQAHYYRGDYQRVIDLAIDNISALPPDWVHEYFGMTVPASVVDRAWLSMSLVELGRFDEAAKYGTEAIQLAEPIQHAFTIGWARFAASILHLAKGEWAEALSVAEQWITMLRKENVGIHLPWAVACSARALAQIGKPNEALNRVQETEQLLDLHEAKGIVGHRGWSYHAVGRAGLILGRLDEARRLGHRALESSQRQPGFKAHALCLLGDVASHSDGFDAEAGAALYREALVLAEQRGMRPLAAHCHFGFGMLYRRTGNLELAGQHMNTAMAMYRDMDMRFGFEHEPDLKGAANGAVGAH